MKTNKEKGELNALLDIKRKEGAAKFTEEKKQIYADGIQSVVHSGVYENALKVGDKAPNFALKDPLNNSISLYSKLKKGPVVLTWYRGGWCPYCNITLQYLQKNLAALQEAGATLLALTPELPDNSLSTAEKNNLEFIVLSDIGNAIAKEFGIVYKLTDAVANIYGNAFGLNEKNGDKTNQLPLAATYVIDTNSYIQYAFLDADYTQRAEVSEILSTLEKLK